MKKKGINQKKIRTKEQRNRRTKKERNSIIINRKTN